MRPASSRISSEKPSASIRLISDRSGVERQEFIIENLRVEKDLVEAVA